MKTEKEIVREALEMAKNAEGKDDYYTAVYMVRDLEITERLGLYNLAWKYDMSPYLTRAETITFLENIETSMNNAVTVS